MILNELDGREEEETLGYIKTGFQFFIKTQEIFFKATNLKTLGGDLDALHLLKQSQLYTQS